MRTHILVSALLVCATQLPAQGPPAVVGRQAGRGAPTPAQGEVRRNAPAPSAPVTTVSAPYARSLIAPELVMMNQREIGLRDDQREVIAKEMADAQSKYVYRQWLLSQQQNRLEDLLQDTTVDEAAVLKAVDGILAAEQDIKRTQMSLLVRVKNTLTPQQQTLLLAMSPAFQGQPGQGGRGGRGIGSAGPGGYLGGAGPGAGARGGRASIPPPM